MITPGSEKNEAGLAWKYGLIGGVVAMLLTIVDYVLFWSEVFPLTMVFFGSLLAGYLAERSSVSDYRAGFVAGIVGSLPGVFSFLPTLYDTATQWISAGETLFALIGMVLIAAFIFGMAALSGLIGGRFGGWVAIKTKSNGSSPPSA